MSAELLIVWFCDQCGNEVELPEFHEAGDCCGQPMEETAGYSYGVDEE